LSRVNHSVGPKFFDRSHVSPFQKEQPQVDFSPLSFFLFSLSSSCLLSPVLLLLLRAPPTFSSPSMRSRASCRNGTPSVLRRCLRILQPSSTSSSPLSYVFLCSFSLLILRASADLRVISARVPHHFSLPSRGCPGPADRFRHR